MYKPVKAPTGTKISCKGWIQEAALRMINNNLDPEVAEAPEELIVYGGSGKAARSWEAFHLIEKSLKELENDETLLIQSGKPVGIFKTHQMAPRVLIANSNLVGDWANWEHFRKLEKEGLMMYGQMTAGSWIYIGTQGILQGTYETFAEAARQHFNGTLKNTITVTAGLGGMGGAQTLACTMNDGVMIAVEIDRSRINKRLETKYCDVAVESYEEAVEIALDAKEKGIAKSIALLGNAAEVLPRMVREGFIPDMVTDQTSAHDELGGYVPHAVSYEAALELRNSDPEKYIKYSYESMVLHMKAIIDMKNKGSIAFDYGNNLRGQAVTGGLENAFVVPGFVPEYIRPLFCEGKGPFRWAALSGDPEDIYRTDKAILETFPNDKPLCRWIRKAQEMVKFQGLPCRICWLGYGERAKFGKIINNLVASGEVKAPIVIGRDHLDSGSVASPYRETEGMKDGTDAVADWPILNALLNTASGASWVSFHHGGGVGIGKSLHAGMVIVADGTKDAEKRLQNVLTNDPGTGVMRHVDAGYDNAVQCAKERGVKIPGVTV